MRATALKFAKPQKRGGPLYVGDVEIIPREPGIEPPENLPLLELEQ